MAEKTTCNNQEQRLVEYLLKTLPELRVLSREEMSKFLSITKDASFIKDGQGIERFYRSYHLL